MNTNRNSLVAVVAGALATLVAACGGGGGGGRSTSGATTTGRSRPSARHANDSGTQQRRQHLRGGGRGDAGRRDAERGAGRRRWRAHLAPHLAHAGRREPVGVYALQGGRCNRAVAEAALAEGTPTRDPGEPAPRGAGAPVPGAGSRPRACSLSRCVRKRAAGGARLRARARGRFVGGVVEEVADGNPLAGVHVRPVQRRQDQRTGDTSEHGGQVGHALGFPAWLLCRERLRRPARARGPDGGQVARQHRHSGRRDADGHLRHPSASSSAPVVHHLAKRQFGGQETCPLQFPNAEGLSHDYAFTLTASQLAHATASFDLMARGSSSTRRDHARRHRWAPCRPRRPTAPAAPCTWRCRWPLPAPTRRGLGRCGMRERRLRRLRVLGAVISFR